MVIFIAISIAIIIIINGVSGSGCNIANILSYDNEIRKSIVDKDNEITKLKKDKDMLIEANSNLLQKVPFGREEEKKKEDLEEPRKFDFKSVFDKNGFKR